MRSREVLQDAVEIKTMQMQPWLGFVVDKNRRGKQEAKTGNYMDDMPGANRCAAKPADCLGCLPCLEIWMNNCGVSMTWEVIDGSLRMV